MRNLSGMNLVNFLAGLFLAQLLFVIGVDGVKVRLYDENKTILPGVKLV